MNSYHRPDARYVLMYLNRFSLSIFQRMTDKRMTDNMRVIGSRSRMTPQPILIQKRMESGIPKFSPSRLRICAFPTPRHGREVHGLRTTGVGTRSIPSPVL
jgi:hypothetical protein